MNQSTDSKARAFILFFFKITAYKKAAIALKRFKNWENYKEKKLKFFTQFYTNFYTEGTEKASTMRPSSKTPKRAISHDKATPECA